MVYPFLGPLLVAASLSAPSLVERGDLEFMRINYPVAEAIYDSALAASGDDPDLLWRLARLYICMADVSPEPQKLDLFRKAESFANRCIRADSMLSEGHTWRAAALGNIAMFEGGRTKIELCHLIKQELDRSIRLDPADDIAYSILGSFYRALGNVSWVERQLATVFLGGLPDGGYEESEQALKMAVALAPGIIRHHSELGELYWEQNRIDEALREFQLASTLPVRLASDERTRQAAVRFIESLINE